MARLRRSVVLTLAGLGFALSMPSARAAGTNADPFGGPFDTTDDADYRKVIREGVAEYQAGHFEEARSLFRRAHGLHPNARTLRGIGMASFELRDYVTAIRHLSAALQDKRKPLSPEQRKGAEDLIDRGRMFVDVYAVKVVPTTARLRVDGREPVFEADGTLLFGLGGHQLEASAPGMAAQSRSIDARGGARKELVLTLEPAPTDVAVAAGQAPPGTAVQTSLPPGASRRAASVWLWAGAGAAVLAAGAGAYWYAQNSELRTCRNPPTGNMRCNNENTLSLQRNIAMGTTLGAGAAALTMTLVGALTWNRGSPPDKRETALSCTLSLYGIACGGVF